ncbi:MAG: hypothetical protein A2V66_06065 [Ignavibacteria bacterium RBG_13_36_8]|nr:MAG: hypothetical protein A2V66_06065 [Ignavibacteria bacterium RBG_13_36_8]
MNKEKNNEYSIVLELLFKEYALNKKPIKINIRKIVSDCEHKRKLLHNIHKYPAKILYSIPFFLLNNQILSKENDVILDPFCGSGTTLLEANMAGRDSIGVDSNPLAHLISEVKTTCYDKRKLEEIERQVKQRIITIKRQDSKLEKGIEIWFSQHVFSQLQKVYGSICEIENQKYQKFFLLCFSQTLGKVSLADPRIYVPVRLRLGKYSNETDNENVKKRLSYLKKVDVFSIFFKIVSANRKLYENNDTSRLKKHWSKVICSDIRVATQKIKKVLSEKGSSSQKVDMVITSPPYAGAQKYIRSSRLSLLWFGYKSSDINTLDKSSIGRESILKNEILKIGETGIAEVNIIIKKILRTSPERAAIAYYYVKEMEESLKKIIKLLKRKKYLVVIIGDNTICGQKFKNHLYLDKIILNLGMSLKLILVDNIQSFGMMTKRNSTAGIIKKEYILIYKKEK